MTSPTATATGLRPKRKSTEAELLRQQATERMLLYVEQNLATVKPGEMARIACYSRFHTPRVFAQVTNMSPKSYISKARVARAATLLTTTDKPVGTICHEVGYASLGTFSAHFKRCMGYSPTAYRRRARMSETM